ncbi:hypothetical protein DACRYDRAFT_59782 [Dacryopinax primogenitus]|uniref:Gylcosyl hydrolase 115 C-terminal domain-containing protein n=1 Tax=Dacryopinax primogenitus (strain DJM 731) TaxID=1858805 RepID=M5FQH9_DACPD|nr:uncharacterized protein DACRYDRAFT_59782 [Dacryopinax primogenitus]EJT96994.1 hypothetical protein DACRYDRAFT_59782 [Dacryopinax primogenitus]
MGLLGSFVLLSSLFLQAQAIGQAPCLAFTSSAGSFPLVASGVAAPIIASADDDPGVLRVAADLQNDIANVTGVRPELLLWNSTSTSLPSTAVLVGTYSTSLMIAVSSHANLSTAGFVDQWEVYDATVVSSPLPGVSNGYVMRGSDRRGTIYAIYEHSEQMGVSPWYWWADVPIKQNAEVHATGCAHGSPSVQYRGIFLNDEQPALQSWAQYTFTNGTGAPFNHYFYSHLFELILRLKGNLLWPAQWAGMFGVDDPENQPLANYYGVVMSTSHEEPMMRSTPNEWNTFGSGPWDFNTNAANITAFWTEGAERAKLYESLYSVGMRGNGDLPLGPATNIALLEKVIATQRGIISSVYNVSDPSVIPQAWCLYKEVEDYWDSGMTVPDDIILLWADDNWGNVRRLPTGNETSRRGGAGMYYHFDYVGAPRDYKWIRSTQLAKVWEQMHLTYERQASKLWVVNVGDLKPYEQDIEFFLTYAYNVSRWNQFNLNDFALAWAQREFALPPEQSQSIVDIISNVTQFNARRKPELLNSTTYSLTNYGEAGHILDTYAVLNATSWAIWNQLDPAFQPAYFQLVHHPLQASYTLQKMYIYAGMNNLYAGQARLDTNWLNDEVAMLFEQDYDLEHQYHTMLDGKWQHIMDQSHMGYAYWQQPMQNSMPFVSRVPSRKTALPGAMRITIDGSLGAWPGDDQYDCSQMYSCPTSSMLPFDTYGPVTRWVDISAGGPAMFNWTASSNVTWLSISQTSGTIVPVSGTNTTTRIWLSVDWSQVNASVGYAQINFQSSSASQYLHNEAMANQLVPFYVQAYHTAAPSNFSGFVEGDGYVAWDAAHATRNNTVDDAYWGILPNYGRNSTGATPFPVAGNNFSAGTGPNLQYDFYLFNTIGGNATTNGNITVTAVMSPSLDNHGYMEPLGYALQLDNTPPISVYPILIVSASVQPPGWDTPDGWVANSMINTTIQFNSTALGKHTLTLWQIEPGVVMQKFIINTGGLRYSYLGPPESVYV